MKRSALIVLTLLLSACGSPSSSPQQTEEPSDLLRGPKGSLLDTIDTTGKADTVSSARILERGHGDIVLRSSFTASQPVLGYVSATGPGATLRANAVFEDSDLPIRIEAHTPFINVRNPGEEIDQGENNTLETSERGQTLWLFSAEHFPQNNTFIFTLECEGPEEACNPTREPESTNAACSDGIDNDLDGYTDCRDFNCSRNPDVTVCQSRPEDTDTACSDGIDNDLDGYTDCEDFGCSRNSAITVCDDPSNDPEEPEELAEICNDEVDNDRNDLIDCNDPACATDTACALPENNNEACSDGIDNDLDGLTDCDDPQCVELSSVSVCTPREDTDEACSDGIDNDNDGYTDCDDFNCSRNPDVSACDEPEPLAEDTEETCSDGLDNDNDGSTDCDDFTCILLAACASGEEGEVACNDGLDNDGNGLKDCEEPSCSPWINALACSSNDPFTDLDNYRGFALRRELQDRIQNHRNLSYDRAREVMYGIRDDIDVHNGRIECIYTGALVSPDRTRTPGNFNTEHSWPRSDGANRSPAESDLHHLFPATSSSNTARESHYFGETYCRDSNTCRWNRGGSALGRSTLTGDLVFDVRPERRGDIARAHFYFSIRYGFSIPRDEEDVLRDWNTQDPPDSLEKTRNQRIFEYQNNLNPFVLHPEFVDFINDF